MSGLLFGNGSGGGNTKETVITGIPITTSVAGEPIPLIYGANKVGGNLIDAFDLQSHEHTTSQSSGKGGSSSSSSTSYSYTSAGLIALGAGPIEGIGRIWQGKDIINNVAVANTDVPDNGTLYIISGGSLGGFTSVSLGTQTITNLQDLNANGGQFYGYITPGETVYQHNQLIAGPILTVTSMISGYTAVGNVITGTGIIAGTKIVQGISGVNSTGTYFVDRNQTVASTVITSGWVDNMWVGHTLYFHGKTFNITGNTLDTLIFETISATSEFNYELFEGARPQRGDWTYAEAWDRHLTYPGIAYIANSSFDLSSSASFQQYNIEVFGNLMLTKNPGDGFRQCYPSAVIEDILKNKSISNIFDITKLGDLRTGPSSYYNYCVSNHLYVSPLIDSRKKASDIITEILTATNSEAAWTSSSSGGMELQIIPYGDIAAVGNDNDGTTCYFTPNTNIRACLSERDIIRTPGTDPITIERTAVSDTFNSWPVEYIDFNNDYNQDIVYSDQSTDMTTYGVRRNSPTVLHCIKDQAMAKNISRLLAQKSTTCKNTYTFDLSWKYIRLDPMDLISISNTALGLNNEVLRIIKITENDKGTLTITAINWPIGTGGTSKHTSQIPGNSSSPNNASPGPANSPDFITPTLSLTAGINQVWVAISGNNVNWGGAFIHVSTDGGTSYDNIGFVNKKSIHGFLTSDNLQAWPYDTIDSSSIPGVDLNLCHGTLSNCTSIARDNMTSNFCYIDGELLSFSTVALTSTNNYNLSNFKRGCYNTPKLHHLTNSRFVKLDNNVFKFTVPDNLINTEIKVKLQSFNTHQKGLEDLSTCTVYSYTLQPTLTLSISNLTQTYSGYVKIITWDKVNNWLGIQYKVRKNGQEIAITDNNYINSWGDDNYTVSTYYNGIEGPESEITVINTYIGYTVIQDLHEDWTGTFDGYERPTSEGKLRLINPSVSFDSLVGNFDSLTGLFDDLSGVSSIGSYIAGTCQINLGAPGLANIIMNYDLSNRTPLVSDCKIYMNIDNAVWELFSPGIHYGTLFQFKVTLTCSDLVNGLSPLFSNWNVKQLSL